MRIKDILLTIRYHLTPKNRYFGRIPNIDLNKIGEIKNNWDHRFKWGETLNEWESGSKNKENCIGGSFYPYKLPNPNSYKLEGRNVIRHYHSDMLVGKKYYKAPFVWETQFEVKQDKRIVFGKWMLTKTHKREDGLEYVTPEPDAFEIDGNSIYFSIHDGRYDENHKMQTRKIYCKLKGKQKMEMYVYDDRVVYRFNGVKVASYDCNFERELYPVFSAPVVKPGKITGWMKVYQTGIYKL